MYSRHNRRFIKKMNEPGHVAFSGVAVGESSRRYPFTEASMDFILVKIFATAFALGEVLTHPQVGEDLPRSGNRSG